jgi:DNA-directed RNA polymerase subunit RPC12/RpoP
MSSSTGTQYRCEKCGNETVFSSLAELEEHNRKKHL